MTPSIGRIVHFYPNPLNPTGHPSAAIIASVHEAQLDAERKMVNLCVISHDGSTSSVRDVPFAAEPTPGHWTWPPRLA